MPVQVSGKEMLIFPDPRVVRVRLLGTLEDLASLRFSVYGFGFRV